MPAHIPLSRDKCIVFMGGMNAMPMMYALELRHAGYDVLYLVDVPRRDTLSRPENHFPEISYPYPEWVIERVMPSQILMALFPRFFAFFYRALIRRHSGKPVGCYVLDGYFSALTPWLEPEAKKVELPHGSDLDTWANLEGAEALAQRFRHRSLFRFLPAWLARRGIVNAVSNQYQGYASADVVVYFPRGFNATGDRIVQSLTRKGIRYVPRADISFLPLTGQSREFKPGTDTLVIFSGVRFLYRTFPDGNTGYNKGNDIIIEGIARYHAINPKIQVHFVDKGEDVQHARELIRQKGLESVVVWHKEMPLKDLLALYQQSDVCFDQVGEHWMGAIGGYALWLGKPVITNADPAIRSGIWPADNPVCNARNAEQVCEWLVTLRDDAVRKRLSAESKVFAETYMGPGRVLDELFGLSVAVSE